MMAPTAASCLLGGEPRTVWSSTCHSPWAPWITVQMALKAWQVRLDFKGRWRELSGKYWTVFSDHQDTFPLKILRNVLKLYFVGKMLPSIENWGYCRGYIMYRFPRGLRGKESACNAGAVGSVPGSRRSNGGGHSHPTPVFLPGESHGQRSLVGYSSWGFKESDITDATYHTRTHTMYICLMAKDKHKTETLLFTIPKTLHKIKLML